jgi:IstB-like ATP binding protein
MATSTKPSTTSRICVERLKAPSLARWVERLAERARSDGWTHEEFLAACLEREVAARQDHSGEGRIRAARFPARKTLDNVAFIYQHSLKRDAITHLGTLDFAAERANVVFLGPRGTCKTHLAIGISIPGPAKPATASRSRPRPSGSPVSATRAAKADSTANCDGSAASRYWSSTRSARSTSKPKLATCSSSSSAPPTSGRGHRHLQQAIRTMGRGVR